MGAVIEVVTLNTCIIGFKSVIEKLQMLNFKFKIESMYVIDNWDFTNYKNISLNSKFECFEEYVLGGKIVTMNFSVNDNYECGYRVFKNKSNIYEESIWLNTYNLKLLDFDIITEFNKTFYDIVTLSIIDILKGKNDKFLLAAIGVETFIKYNNDLATLINDSKNINRWILPSNQEITIDNYVLDLICNYNVYSKYKDSK